MRKIILAALSVLFMISGCVSNKDSNNAKSPVNTLVFVHGAHLTSNAWSFVATLLEKDGYNTIAVNLPGREQSINPNSITLDVSSQALCDAIKNVTAPITFIAHSQGGAIVNNALSICPTKNIKNIIYVAAVAPVHNDKPFALLNSSDEENYFKGVSFDEESGWMIISDRDSFVSVFTNSISNEIRTLVLSQAVNEPAITGDGVVSYDAAYFSKINKFYIYTKKDKIISLKSQKTIAEKIGLKGHVIIDTGHLPMISSPLKLASQIKTFLT
ncbi:MAG: alpha/beta hydrolase [Gammaproteobacteria bacterium]|nr:MAG: alpha/beta hydrolase [Gammaproteobacteria bacterium]